MNWSLRKTQQLEVNKHPHTEIVKAALNGNRKAELQLYQLYVKAMFNSALRLLNNHQDAEDVLQETFVTAFNRIDTYRFDSTFGSWLKRIVINKGINFLNQRKLEVAYEDVHDCDISIAEESDYEKEVKYSVECIRNAMIELADGYRVILSLYLFEGYDHMEIAGILDISTSTSKSQYHRAKKKLKTILLSNYET